MEEAPIPVIIIVDLIMSSLFLNVFQWHLFIYLFIYWIYWGDIRCAILQYIIYILYCMFTTSNQVPFQYCLSPLAFFYFPTPFLSSNDHTVVCVELFFLNPFIFSPRPKIILPCQSVLYLWVCFYFVSLFSTLDST